MELLPGCRLRVFFFMFLEQTAHVLGCLETRVRKFVVLGRAYDTQEWLEWVGRRAGQLGEEGGVGSFLYSSSTTNTSVRVFLEHVFHLIR